jgi:O-antigen/teichoic acid export membrane protein
LLTCGLALATIILSVTTDVIDGLFEGFAGLVVCLIIALFTYCFQHVTRGTLSGNGRFRPYGMILGAEGIIRFVPVVALAAAGVSNPVWYGLCLAIPPLLGSLVSLIGQHGLLAPGPSAPWSELSANLGFLLGGSLLAQTLSYAPFIGAQVLATPAEKAAVADFVVGLFLARIPILLFQAVQAALLPKLAHLAGSGQHDDFRTGVRKLVLVVVGIAVIGVVAAATLGPAVGEILFGSKFTLGNVDLALLAAGSGLFIVALTLAQALIALLGHAKALVAWSIGLAMFVVVTAVAGGDLFRRVEVGYIAGTGAAAAVMGLMLSLQLRRGIPDDGLASLVEQIEHEPLEI